MNTAGPGTQPPRPTEASLTRGNTVPRWYTLAFGFDSVSGGKVDSSKDRRGLKYDRSERGRSGISQHPPPEA